jgi:succinyl-CoA---D-citramalate CoA-transferase
VVAALYRRDRADGGTGRGGVVDAPLYGSILRVLEWTIAGRDRLGLTRERQGNRLANSAPLDNYVTSDGRYVCIVAGSDANFGRLCRAMGRPELADDPHWSTLKRRAEGGDVINAMVAEWAATMDARELEAVCVAHGVPVGVAYDAAEIIADPHMAARGDLVSVDDPVAGPHLQQAPFPRLDGQRPEAPSPAPTLGEHNREVWCDLVGLDEETFEAHRSAGVI